jgi:NAD-dependent DNA ligase
MKTLEQLKRLYLRAKEAYYNTEPIMSDADFDRLENSIAKQDPKWPELKKTGVAVEKKAKGELPNFMPSLNKCYPEKMPKWLATQKIRLHLVMDKLDGSALHLTYLAGRPYKLFTRGDGMVGGDVSFLLPLLKIPQRIPYTGPLSLRCEGVMRKNVFDKKYAADYDNARNLVNGLFNRKLSKSDSSVLKDVDIVVLGVFMSEMAKGLEKAQSFGFTVVPHVVAEQIGGTSGLSKALAMRKEKSPYAIDGLVVTEASNLFMYASNDKPKWVVAFKENVDDSAHSVEVEKIIYQVSHRGRIIPKIQIVPTRMDGVTVKFATCHNAKWMKDRKIGPGAVIRILRSGGVIPKIVGVDKPGKFQPPKVPYRLEGVHFVLDGAHEGADREAGIQALKKFLNTLGVEFIAVKTIATLYDRGCTSPFHYMSLAHKGNVTPLIKAGLGKVQSSKILDELVKAFTNTSLLKLMVSSNLFGVGIGERRLRAIEAAGISMSRLIAVSESKLRTKLLEIDGFGDNTVEIVLAGRTEHHHESI